MSEKKTGRKVSWRLIVGLLAIAAGITIWWLAREHLALEKIVAQERALRSSIDAQPWAAWAVGFVVYVLVSLFPGTSGKSVICGWLYGFWASLTMITVALTLAALAGFLLSRYVLQDTIRNRFPRRLRRLDRALEREGAFYMLTLRMLHVPYTFVNYAAGASTLRTSTFAWTTMIGLIPSTMIFAGLGASLPTLEQLMEQGVSQLISPPLIAALILMGLVPWALRWVIRRWRGDSDELQPEGSKA